MDDREIVRLMLARDERALSAAEEKYGARLIRLAYGILREKQSAEECVSDAYLDAWNSIPPHEPCEHLYNYLGRLTRCRALDRLTADRALKRSAVTVELTEELAAALPSGMDVVGEVEANELAELINGFLGTLPKEKRDIFVRRYWFTDTVKEIARLTGRSESGVKMLLMRLRAGLKDYLNERGYAAGVLEHETHTQTSGKV